jgi:ATP-binding cassette subfamily C exporter for protease/lipase
MSLLKSPEQPSILKTAIQPQLKDISQAVIFSFFVNLLVLAPSWYMLEVYDRVINSQSLRTLLMLTILVVVLYALLEMLEWVRSGIMQKAAKQFDAALRERVFNSVFQAKLRQLAGGSTQALADLKVIQDAIASPALMALIDLPFALLTLLLIFWINTTLGWFAVFGALILGIIASVNQLRVQPPLVKANLHAIEAQSYANGAIRNAQVIESMGMLSRIQEKWMKKQHAFLHMQALASDRAGLNSSISKFTQTLQGSLLLGLGCWLTLKGELSMGGSMMIIASILGGRVLAPLLVIVMHWRVVMDAQDAIKRLDNFLKAFPETKQSMPLPPPIGLLSVEGLVASPPNSQHAILKGITFTLAAGQSLGIVGPSASGKSTLARLITGIWPALNGSVRLDGVDIFAWDKNELGPFVGYLPQNVELFDGTLAENIARFGDVDMVKVADAAKIVGLDNFALGLKDGYESQLGDEGAFLSGGQRQRVALARAIYGMPKFIVLDEPNSSLDEEGDTALLRTLQYIKSKGSTLIIITHRVQVMSVIDSILLLVDGKIKALGPRDEVLKSLIPQNPSPTKPKAGAAP